MKNRFVLILTVLALVPLACGQAAPAPESPLESAGRETVPAPDESVFDAGRTAYGFFPSPPEVTFESVLATIKGIGEHGDVLLIQRNIPWTDFVEGVEVESQDLVDIRNLLILAGQNDLGAVFVVDPLNGLNRREFLGLPDGWQASFANPDVRLAFTNYTLRILHEFHPRYLGLASEINTYADEHPDDFQNYLSLYREVYGRIKAESPETQVFVTFQWEDLNNLFGQAEPGHKSGEINWDQVESFEPQLDLWVISSYPFAAFRSGADIPADYYTPLLTHTDRPLAVAEGGFTSKDVGPFHGKPEDQVAYLNAIHTQIGGRLAFWIYLLYSDFNIDSYGQVMRQRGNAEADVSTLGMFTSVGLTGPDGTAKPALEVWDSFRNQP